MVRGRGSTDDKGPVYVVLKTAQAFLDQEKALPLNVKFLFEGEEEIGSPNLPGYLAEHAGELAADLVISADGAMWRPSEPSVSLMSKGLVRWISRSRGPAATCTRAGSAAPSPTRCTRWPRSWPACTTRTARWPCPASTTASRRSPTSAAPSSPGWTSARRATWPRWAWRRRHGEAGYTTLERLWERPTLDVNGISGGGKYTVIPHVAVAHVSCRLVPGQDPDAVIDAITGTSGRAPAAGTHVSVHPDVARMPPTRSRADHPAITAATAALEAVYPGQQVLQVNVPERSRRPSSSSGS